MQPVPPQRDASTCTFSRRSALVATGWILLGGCSRRSENDAGVTDAPPGATKGAATDAAQARLAFDTSMQGSGFVVGKAQAEREMRVFFDPQCSHCAALWLASKPLLDRIRMVWMPVAFIAPSSAPQGVLLLAATEPARTMDEHEALLAKGQGGLATAGPPDATLLTRVRLNTELWSGLKASSVPYLMYRAGKEGPYGVLAGGLPTAELVQLLGL